MTEDPFATPSSAPSINKIPFLVFDAILVITAVALAFSAGGPLSPVLFFWILLCVVGGGLVACLPFWIEFRDKVRLSEYEIRERQNSIHDSQWQYVDARLVEQNEYLQKLHLRLSDSAERLASLERRPPPPTADEVAVLCGSALQKQWPGWREELLTVLSRRTDVLFNEQNAQSAKLSAAQEKRLAELRTEFTSVQSVLRGLESRVGEIALLTVTAGTAIVAQSARATAVQEPPAKSGVRLAAAPVNPDASATGTGIAPAAGGDCAVADTAAIDFTAADAAVTHQVAGNTDSAAAEAESSVAENTAADSAAADEAVADADFSFTPEAVLPLASEDEALAGESAEEYWTEDDDSDPEEWADADADDSEDWDEEDSDIAANDIYAEAGAEAESEVTDEAAQNIAEDTVTDAPLETDAVVAEEAFIEELATAEEQETASAEDPANAAAAPVEPVTERVAPVEPAQQTSEQPSAQTSPEQPALLETPEPVARPAKAAPTEKTTLVAQVLIGIGNKPYVRGIGPGLSLTKGVPMQFVEIGKWEWVCPSGATPVKIQIYKNDEVPSTLGQIELEAGQRKAVTPFFPK